MPRIVAVGSGGHARVVIDVIRHCAELELVGIIDRNRPTGEKILGTPVIGDDEEFPRLAQRLNIEAAVVALGDNYARANVVERIRRVADLQFPTLVHPTAYVAPDAKLGQGTVVFPGAIVNTGSQVGEFCILNTHCSLDHDGRMGNFAALAPGACTGGAVTIGDFSVVCIGAKVSHGVAIGRHTVIGAGSTVLTDIGDQVVAYGTPARVIRSREPGERYL